MIELKAAPGSDPVLDPKIVTAILSNRIFAQTGSGQCNQLFISGVTFGGIMFFMLVCFFIICPKRFCCMEESDGDYGTTKVPEWTPDNTL